VEKIGLERARGGSSGALSAQIALNANAIYACPCPVSCQVATGDRLGEGGDSGPGNPNIVNQTHLCPKTAITTKLIN